MIFDSKALDAAEAEYLRRPSLWEATPTARCAAIITAYLTHALPAILAAAERRGAEAMRERAAERAKTWAEMPAVMTTARKRLAAETGHRTAAQIETEIRALSTEPTP